MLISRHLLFNNFARRRIFSTIMPKKVCLVGSGNWGSAVATLIGRNVLRHPDVFDSTVNMYVYEEEVEVEGRSCKLSEVINERHENVKYLPDIKLPKSIRAVTELEDAARDAQLIVWVVPHQFVQRMVGTVKSVMGPEAMSISLIKGGIEIEDGQIRLISNYLSTHLGPNHPVSVLMGANIANEVARGDFCEATVGFQPGDEEKAKEWQKLFTTPTFSVRYVPDVPGVELCGALKNIVALGAGFVDGMKLGGNTKAAIIRIGLQEIRKFVRTFYANTASDETYFESCGVADLITTCYGGRNRKCADMFARERSSQQDGGNPNTNPKSWEQIEHELLDGQKLQGTLTCDEIVSVLVREGKTESFPLIMNIYGISFKGQPLESLFENLET